jgi:hypothetical protein
MLDNQIPDEKFLRLSAKGVFFSGHLADFVKMGSRQPGNCPCNLLLLRF